MKIKAGMVRMQGQVGIKEVTERIKGVGMRIKGAKVRIKDTVFDQHYRGFIEIIVGSHKKSGVVVRMPELGSIEEVTMKIKWCCNGKYGDRDAN